MNPATACAEVLVDELLRHGVRHAVLCPGSRSAPLAFAVHAAAVSGRLELHVRTDERSAGFLALGLAKAGSPVPIVTTSGTAVANLHPAVLEASHAGVPLLVVSADRPAELRGTGANQTTDQVGIFGQAVRWAYDLGTADQRIGQVAGWRAMVSRAVAAATGARSGAGSGAGSGQGPGPIHLNVPLREPLVPDADGAFVEPLDGRPRGAAWTQVCHITIAAEAIEDHPGTLMVVGDLPLRDRSETSWGSAAARLARHRGWPMIAEPSSGARGGALDHGSLLLGCQEWLAQHRPQRVVVVGRPTLGRAVPRLLRQPGMAVDLVSPAGPWPDPGAAVRRVLPLESLLAKDSDDPTRDEHWLGEWTDAASRVAAAAKPLIDDSWPSGVAVAFTIGRLLTPAARLFVGSSNPVRDLDIGLGGAGPEVVANRGLAGIDGCVATAVGLALSQDRPAYALLGDLTFAHDVAGLMIGPHERRPDLTLVVVNDDGGGIFGHLEPGHPRHAEAFERVFGTPLGLDLADLCAGVRVRHTLARTPDELAEVVSRPPSGLHVVQVVVDRAEQRGLYQRLRAAAAAALV